MKKKLIFAAVAVVIITLTLVFLSAKNKTDKQVAVKTSTEPVQTQSQPEVPLSTSIGDQSNQPTQQEFPSRSSDSQTRQTTQPKTSASVTGRSAENVISVSGISDELLEVIVPKIAGIYSELPKKFSAVKNDVLTKIEPVNEKNQPLVLTTADYFKKAGLQTPPNLNQASKVTMYIFKKSSDFGPSEALVIENENSAIENAELMKKWEPSLVNDAKAFILIGEKYDLIKTSGFKNIFSYSSIYPHQDCRYINITKDKAITLDYVTRKGSIVLANSLSVFDAVIRKMGIMQD